MKLSWGKGPKNIPNISNAWKEHCACAPHQKYHRLKNPSILLGMENMFFQVDIVLFYRATPDQY